MLVNVKSPAVSLARSVRVMRGQVEAPALDPVMLMSVRPVVPVMLVAVLSATAAVTCPLAVQLMVGLTGVTAVHVLPAFVEVDTGMGHVAGVPWTCPVVAIPSALPCQVTDVPETADAVAENSAVWVSRIWCS